MQALRLTRFYQANFTPKFSGNMCKCGCVVVRTVFRPQYLAELGSVDLQVSSKLRNIYIRVSHYFPYVGKQFGIHARRHRRI